MLHRFHGLGNGDGFGEAVASIGDANRDGVDDVIVLAQNGTKGAGTTGGYVHVFSGKDGTRLWSRHFQWGHVPRDAQGVGDVNRDGYPDWAVAADSTSGAATAFYSGKDGLYFHVVTGLGSSVCGIGDIDADGYADVAIGFQYANASAGHVQVISTRTWSALRTLPGAQGGDYFGRLVRPAGDVDKDGHVDLVIGKRSRGSFVNSSSTGNGLVWGKPAANYTMSACCVGDVDRDGFPDFLFGNSPETIGSAFATGAARLIAGQAPIADLTVSALDGPQVVYRNVTHRFNYTVANVGLANASAFRVGFYLGTSTTQGSLLGYASFPALSVGSSPQWIDLKMPANLALGPCVLRAIVDDQHVVREIHEDNNTRLAPLSCQVGQPDLTPTSVSPLPRDANRRAFDVGVTVKNIGVAPAASSTTRVYLSSDSTLDTSDTALGGRSFGSLAPEASQSLPIFVSIPASVTGGSYYFIAQAGIGVSESNTTNNVRAVQVSIGSLATDLSVSSLSVQGVAASGGSITVAYGLQNLSAQPTGAITLDFTVTQGGVRSEKRVVLSTGLDGNGSTSDTAKWTLSICFDAGPASVSLSATPATVDSNRANNYRAVSTSLAAYNGVPRLEMHPSSSQDPTRKELDAAVGGRANMCVAAPALTGSWALTLLSLQASTPVDAATMLGLSLVNGPMFPSWFAQTSASSGKLSLAFVLPPKLVTGSLDLYARTALFHPSIVTFAGATNVVAFAIR